MPLSDETKLSIHGYLLVELSRYIKENAGARQALVTKPFHARLLPALFNVALSERSFSTRSGSWWQQLARLVGRQYHERAELGYRVHGQLKPAASQHIDEILRQLNTPNARKPDRSTDIAEVCTVQAPGGDSVTLLADLFILTHDGEECYFEMKTPQPNKDTSMAMKRFVLRLAAMRMGHKAEAFAATAYNPFGDGEPYTWNYATQFLEVGADLLVGRSFWAKIGDESTYDELLEISEEVGKEISDLIAASA
jgi:Type II restriction endonuclease, TdeIII